MTDRLSRRRLIALSGAVGAAALAGCGDEGPGEEEDPVDDGDDPAEEEEEDPVDEEEDPDEDEDEDDDL
ncbi:hypothetical protein G6M89_09535 [Natronolimnobius sp. AArcel1]|uniref:hypothetical protein n=1 Tax=Natronolimnobius sp. AArcel1 TaxID=1679093 RepID=UPI0013ED5CCC|nr:hypothetical protein [Natronolimnobius sp. AArcel1]NGM69245.1 hypothetical protein [Natronolimnobius sp. AArcel1]